MKYTPAKASHRYSEMLNLLLHHSNSPFQLAAHPLQRVWEFSITYVHGIDSHSISLTSLPHPNVASCLSKKKTLHLSFPIKLAPFHLLHDPIETLAHCLFIHTKVFNFPSILSERLESSRRMALRKCQRQSRGAGSSREQDYDISKFVSFYTMDLFKNSL